MKNTVLLQIMNDISKIIPSTCTSGFVVWNPKLGTENKRFWLRFRFSTGNTCFHVQKTVFQRNFCCKSGLYSWIALLRACFEQRKVFPDWFDWLQCSKSIINYQRFFSSDPSKKEVRKQYNGHLKIGNAGWANKNVCGVTLHPAQ